MQENMTVIEVEIEPKGIGIIILNEALKEEKDTIISLEIERQKSLGAKCIRLCDKSRENLDNNKLENSIGMNKFKWYTDFYLMKLPCKAMGNSDGRLSLRLLEKTEINKFIAVYSEAFKDVPNNATYSYEGVLEMYEDDKMEVGFICHDGDVIGFYELGGESGEEGEIAAIGLLPKFRGQSLGKQSLECINDYFKHRGYEQAKLLVACINTKALELYKKMGFEICGDIYSRWYQCHL